MPHRMRQRSMALVAGLLLAGLCAVAAPIAATDAVDDYLEAQMRRNHIPALSVVVVQDGVEAKVRSLGIANLEWGVPVMPDTVFQLASVTKILTGMGLMRLVERGVLSLDAPLSKYLADTPEAWRPITIRHLATHTSGLPDDLGSERLDTGEQIIAAAMKRPLSYEPGSRSAYGFTDFVVLQRCLRHGTSVANRGAALSYAPTRRSADVAYPNVLINRASVVVSMSGR